MKKIIIVLFLLLNVLIVEKVYAQTYNLTLDRQDGIYYARRGGDLPYYSSQFIIYRLGNDIAYCIEPSKNITTYNYVDSDGHINLPYSDEIKRKIQLIGYYGREYEGHDNVYYSMAAQALIWNLTSNQEITFWTGLNETGNIIDVSREKNEIMNLVNNYKYLNISQNIESDYNQLFKFKDDLLRNYYISDYGSFNNENGRILLEDDELKISSKIIGEAYFEIKRNTFDEKETLIYIGSDKDNSQTLGRLRLPDNPIRIKINTKGIKIKIYKYDEKNNPIKISGIKFKIKKMEDNSYVCENNDCLFETDSNGIVTTKELPFGEYQIEEINNQIIPGYAVNSEIKTVEIKRNKIVYYTNQDGHFVMVNFINHQVKGKILLQKEKEEFEIIDDDIVYKMIKANNIIFKLYDENNNYIDDLITDNGYASYENLPVGKYYLQEITPDSYIDENNKLFFEIQQTNATEEEVVVNLKVHNVLKKGNLKVAKLDKEDLEGIPNTLFDIYYNDEYLFSKETDEKGEINLIDLPIGNYYLQEKEANEMYQLTNEKRVFTIKENELTNLEVFNEKITVDVPNTLDNTNKYLNISTILLLLVGLIYEKRF